MVSNGMSVPFQAPPVLAFKRSDKETGDAVTLYTDYVPVVFESMKTYEDEGLEGLMVSILAFYKSYKVN